LFVFNFSGFFSLFVSKVKDALLEYSINSWPLLEEQENNIFQKFYSKMELAIDKFGGKHRRSGTGNGE
jgi:hypothetical protein